jgi:predicted DNA-binding transcriptional regulator AlpA
MESLLDVHDVARILGRSVNTLKRNLCRNPAVLPPRMQLQSDRLLRWRPEKVREWMETIQATSAGAFEK